MLSAIHICQCFYSPENSEFFIARPGRSVHWYNITTQPPLPVLCNCIAPHRQASCGFLRLQGISDPSTPASPLAVSPPQHAWWPHLSPTASSPIAAQHSSTSPGGIPVSLLPSYSHQHIPWSTMLQIPLSQQGAYTIGQRPDSGMPFVSNYSFKSSSTIASTFTMDYNHAGNLDVVSFCSPSTLSTAYPLLSPQLEEHRIYVKNLDPRITKEDLVQHFSCAGVVLNVEIHHRRGSRFRGSIVAATIMFASAEDVSLAIRRLDGTVWSGRVLCVMQYRGRKTTRRGNSVHSTPRYVPAVTMTEHVPVDNTVTTPSSVSEDFPEPQARSSGPHVVDGSFRRQR